MLKRKGQTEQQKLGNKNGKKKNCMDISTDKLAKFNTRRPGLRKGKLKRETKSLLIVVQNNAIRTNYIKAKIDYTQQNSKCKFRIKRDETINH